MATKIDPAIKAASNNSYGQILRSTALIGGSQVVGILFAVVRAKAMAIILGPAGMGLFGLYSSVADLFQTVAGVGIQSSGVRQIADARSSGDEARIARTVAVLRWSSILLGLVGALLLIAVARPVAIITFGGPQETAGIALLGIAVGLRVVSAGQSALIQGMRRISDLARLGILAGVFSTLISIPLVYWFGARGVAPALVGIAATSLLSSWWYSRKVQVAAIVIAMPQIADEARSLLKLGFAFMASGLLTAGSAYAVRLIVLRNSGLDAAGHYQAAWALGGIYAGFILQAMSADFYPRLTAAAKLDSECNRLVNEQAAISILLAAPGVMATLTFAPIIMTVFYSQQFLPAEGLLRWICLGMMLRILAWPMGFIVLAKGAQQIFFWTEIAATVVHVGLAWVLVRVIGPDGAGAAFFGLYVWHSLLIYAVVRRMTGFRWSGYNVRLGAVLLPATGLVFCVFFLLPPLTATLIGAVATLATGIYAMRELLAIMGTGSLPRVIHGWLPLHHKRGP